MLSIHLHKLLFYSYHGVHEEERVLGGEFEVNLTVSYHPTQVPIKHLEETINYVNLFSLVKRRMELRSDLLETIATEIAGEVMKQYQLAHKVDISIIKLHPPIEAFQGSVGVSFTLKREQ